MYKLIIALLFAMLVITLTGCGDDNHGARTSTEQGSVLITVAWPEPAAANSRYIPASATKLKVNVTRDNITLGSVTITRPATSGRIDKIPVGPVVVTGEMRDASSATVSKGTANAMVVLNTTVTVTLDYLPTGEGTSPLVGDISWFHGLVEHDTLWPPSRFFNKNRQISGMIIDEANNINRTFRLSPGGAREIFPVTPGYSMPMALNNHGDVLGYVSYTPPGGAWTFKNYVWLASGEIRYLNKALPGSQLDQVRDFNDSQQVVGRVEDNGIYHGLLWGTDGPVEILPGFTTSDQVNPLFINNTGHIFGTINDQPVRWNSDKSIVSIPVPAGYTLDTLIAFNDKDQVLARMLHDGHKVAVRWEADGSMTDLGRLAGDTGVYDYAPTDMNNSGLVVGSASCPDVSLHLPDQSFLWTQGSGMQQMTGVSDNHINWVGAINDLGEVFGACAQKEPGTNNQFAIWTPK